MSFYADGEYVLGSIEHRLPEAAAAPMLTVRERDAGIVNHAHYFDSVRTRLAEKLPDVDTAVLTAKQNRAVAGARRAQGVSLIDNIMITTHQADTARSLYRFVTTDTFTSVDPEDTPDSLYLRTGDYVDDLLAAAELERIPLSGYRRQRGSRDIRQRFEDRDPDLVRRASALAGRNSMRKVFYWLNKLEIATRGLGYIGKGTVGRFMIYAAEERPTEYFEKPNLIQELAKRSRNFEEVS